MPEPTISNEALQLRLAQMAIALKRNLLSTVETKLYELLLDLGATGTGLLALLKEDDPKRADSWPAQNVLNEYDSMCSIYAAAKAAKEQAPDDV